MSGEFWEGADLVGKLANRWPVKAAFWLREANEDWGHLLIAVEGFDGLSKRPVYRDVGQFAREASYPDFNYDRVRVIGTGDPRARAAIDLNERYPDPKGHRTGPMMFGDVFAEDLYVYPTPTPAAVS